MSKIRNFLGRNLSSKATRDKLSKRKRSALMARIRSRKTSFEVNFFRVLRRNKVDFIPHPKRILGHPDLLIKGTRICVFLDSDFWHGWQYPRWKHKLKNDSWRLKIERNRKRDRYVTQSLRGKGWAVIRLWEHTLIGMNENDIASLIRR